MKKLFLPLILVLFQNILCVSDYSICFIHIGENKFPPYLNIAVEQARLFNNDCSIYVLVNATHKSILSSQFAEKNIEIVALEDIPRTPEHDTFEELVQFNKKYKSDYWIFTRERFLSLYDFMKNRNLRHVFHLENDVMLYTELKQLLPFFEKHYQTIGATFDSDERVIAGFVYVASTSAAATLAKFLSENAARPKNDMAMLALFKQEYPESIDHLPIVTKEYAFEHTLTNKWNHIPKDSFKYYRYADTIGSIFDAAALGQYIGGTHKKKRPGFINEACIFNPSYYKFAWEIDSKGRKVPYASYGSRKYRINNLHIHSKKLENYTS